MQLDFLSENWSTIVWSVPGAWMVIVLTVFWTMPRIDFHVRSNAVVIEWMGFALRRIPLSDINRVSKRLKGKPEVWRNTLKANHRMLVLYRKSGMRPVVITPHNRYVFRNQLETNIKSMASPPN
ncbi:MAG: hypothetical protein QF721_00285 [Verrucomicrobiota bacterium]|nr:hypothetical protein [Verrucomicrobiota bacterium]MDP7047866.1 hypothetical protein [Verrucomicrobiota bacterium]